MGAGRGSDRAGRAGPRLALVAAIVAGLAAPAIAATGEELPAEPEAPPPLNEPVAIGEVVSDPIEAAKRDVYARCLSAGFPDDFVRWEDLNADGEADALIEYDVVCDGYRGALCGVEGCPGAVFVSDGEGAYRRVDLPPDASAIAAYDGLPAVAVSMTGRNCRRGVRLCRGVRVWDGTAFVPPEELGVSAAEASAAPAPPIMAPPTAIELAALAEDYETTVALFDRGEPPYDPLVADRADRLEAAGAIRVARGWRSFQPSEQWSYEPIGERRARAWVRGVFGVESLQVACRAGDPAVAVAFFSREGVFGEAFRSGVAAAADFVVSGDVRETVLLRYVRRRDIWVSRVSPDGPLLEWLRRGSTAYVLEPGARLGGRYGDGYEAAEFSLTGSRRAIEAALSACGLPP
ncbi:MAG: hypothetical protein AAGM38_15515 [Pseudomonadota bacterium]